MSKESGVLEEGWRGEGRRRRGTEKQKCREWGRSRDGHRRGGGQRERGIPHKERKTMSFRYREEVKKRKKGEQGGGGEIVPSLKPGLG